MKIWSIESDNGNFDIETNNITILFGDNIKWFHLIRQIDDFFNNRYSTVKIYEDARLMNKKEWDCHFIPFDAHIQLDKITTKSPLFKIRENAAEQLTYSPLYNELLDVWSGLNDELVLFNQKLKRWGIQATLRETGTKVFSENIVFFPIKKMKPLDYKKLLLNIIVDSPFENNNLIILELPELYTDEEEMDTFCEYIKELANKGYQIFIVTNTKFKAMGRKESWNYCIMDVIVNHAVIEQRKSKIINDLPFFCEDALFETAKELLFKVVDNSISLHELKQIIDKNYDSIVTIIFAILYNLGIEIPYELEDLEPNLKMFLREYKS